MPKCSSARSLLCKRYGAFLVFTVGSILCSLSVLCAQADDSKHKNFGDDSLSRCRDRVYLESEARLESSLVGLNKVSLMINRDAFPQDFKIDLSSLRVKIVQRCVEAGLDVASSSDEQEKLPVLTVSINSMTKDTEATESVKVFHLSVLEHILLARNLKIRDLAPTFQYESLVSVRRDFKPSSEILEKHIFNAVEFFLIQWKQQNRR